VVSSLLLVGTGVAIPLLDYGFAKEGNITQKRKGRSFMKKSIWKVIVFAAIVAMFAALGGCSGGSSSSSAPIEPAEEDPTPTASTSFAVKDTAGDPVVGAKVYAIPVEAVEALAAVDLELVGGNYTEAALTVDEPLEDLVNGNFTYAGFSPAEDYIETDADGNAEISAEDAADQGKYFIYVQPADETHFPGGSICREPVSLADLEDAVIEVSTKPSADAEFIGSTTCLLCHPAQGGMTKTAHKLGFMAPGAPSGLQDPSEFDANDGIYNMFAAQDKYAAGTTVYFYDYDGNRSFDKFKTLETDPGNALAKVNLSKDVDGKYWVEFVNIINPGSANDGMKHEVKLTYGGPVYKQRPITAIGNSLYLLPLQFNATGDDASADRTKKVWRDYHMDWWWNTADNTFKSIPAAIKAVDVQCASCHFTGFSLAANDDGTYTASGVADPYGELNPNSGETQELNVGCETCHGPGSEHVAAFGKGVAIVTPQNLTPEREVGICIQCHSRPKGNGGTDQNDCPLNQDDEMMRAGTSRADYLANYTVRHDSASMWPDGKHSKAHHQQGTDFLQTGKYRNGSKLMTCADCHDLHAPGTDRHQLSGNSDNTLCLTCHNLDLRDHQIAKTGWNMGDINCSDCHNYKVSGSGAGINPTEPFVGNSGTEYLHNDISSHLFDVPKKSVAAPGGDAPKMPVPYTNPCGICHSGYSL
jgi:hypothetical protein